MSIAKPRLNPTDRAGARRLVIRSTPLAWDQEVERLFATLVLAS